MINTFFSDLIGKGVYAYLDDLILCSKDGDNHLAKLVTVLLKLREASLKAKLTKCECLKSITFLGHTVVGDGIHTMDDKISVIKNFPQPQNVERVRSFLTLCGYYRPSYAVFPELSRLSLSFWAKKCHSIGIPLKIKAFTTWSLL